MNVDDAAEQLYALAPAEFTARRTALAAEARKDGQSDIAKEIAELRRPTVSAGLINQLFRTGQRPGPAGSDHSGNRDSAGQDSADQDSADQGSADQDSAGQDSADQLAEQLRALGVRLREAQAELDGALMRELTRERQQLVAALIRRAGDLAAENGQKLSGAVERELEETFGAAVADEQAGLAVTSGRLTRALVYAGLGEVDVTAATATPLNRMSRPKTSHLKRVPSAGQSNSAGQSDSADSSDSAGSTGRADSSKPAADRPTNSPSDLAERRRAAEAAKLADATEALTSAQTTLAEAEAELATTAQAQQSAQAREADLSTRLDDLQREIVRTRHELDAAARATANADRDHRRQERHVQDARKATQRAEQARARLAPDPTGRTS